MKTQVGPSQQHRESMIVTSGEAGILGTIGERPNSATSSARGGMGNTHYQANLNAQYAGAIEDDEGISGYGDYFVPVLKNSKFLFPICQRFGA